MARKVITGVMVDLTKGSRDFNGLASSIPEFQNGEEVMADSGIYTYGQAHSIIAEGYACYYTAANAYWDLFTNTISGSTNSRVGICVTSGGLAANQWGWFWRGLGTENVYLTASIAVDTQLTAPTTAGQVTTGNDPIHDLFNNVASGGSGGLTSCRSNARLSTNATITN